MYSVTGRRKEYYKGNNLLLIKSKINSFPDGSVGKESTCNAEHIGDPGLIPWSGRLPRVGNGSPLQYLAWENPWSEKPEGLQSIGVTKCWTQLSNYAHIHRLKSLT